VGGRKSAGPQKNSAGVGKTKIEKIRGKKKMDKQPKNEKRHVSGARPSNLRGRRVKSGGGLLFPLEGHIHENGEKVKRTANTVLQ